VAGTSTPRIKSNMVAGERPRALSSGEIAINTADRPPTLYVGGDGGQVIALPQMSIDKGLPGSPAPGSSHFSVSGGALSLYNGDAWVTINSGESSGSNPDGDYVVLDPSNTTDNRIVAQNESTIPLTVRGAVNHTASIFAVEDSSAVKKLEVLSSGGTVVRGKLNVEDTIVVDEHIWFSNQTTLGDYWVAGCDTTGGLNGLHLQTDVNNSKLAIRTKQLDGTGHDFVFTPIGTLSLPQDPTNDEDAIRKSWADDNYIPTDGDAVINGSLVADGLFSTVGGAFGGTVTFDRDLRLTADFNGIGNLTLDNGTLDVTGEAGISGNVALGANLTVDGNIGFTGTINPDTDTHAINVGYANANYVNLDDSNQEKAGAFTAAGIFSTLGGGFGGNVIVDGDITARSATNGISYLRFGDDVDARGHIQYDNDSDEQMQFWTDGAMAMALANDKTMVAYGALDVRGQAECKAGLWVTGAISATTDIVSTGGVGTFVGGHALAATNLIPGGDVHAASNGFLQISSDKRLKKNETPLPYGLKEILALMPVTYNWIDEGFGTATMAGFMAQDVLPVIPEAVTYHEKTDAYGFDTRAVVATLVNAVKELKEEVNELKGMP
jgi:hypothetical protein